MRARKAGTIVWIGSLTAWQACPNSGLYSTTKYAIRGIAETIHVELASISEDLRSIYIEPGHFRTNVLSPAHRTDYVPRINDYKTLTDKINQRLVEFDQHQPGDPEKFVQFLLDYAKREGKFAGAGKLPVGLPAGSDSFEAVSQKCKDTLKVLEEWEDVIRSTDFPEGS